MSNRHKTRLAKLEQVQQASTHRVSQIVIYDFATGAPLTPIDEAAARYVWIPDNGREPNRPSR